MVGQHWERAAPSITSGHPTGVGPSLAQPRLSLAIGHPTTLDKYCHA